MPRSAPPQKHAASRHRENAKRHNDTKTADRTITDTATRQILRNPHHPLSGSVLSGLDATLGSGTRAEQSWLRVVVFRLVDGLIGEQWLLDYDQDLVARLQR